MSWCAGFGRLGGTGGPLVGLLIGAGLSFHAILLAYLALRRSARFDPARAGSRPSRDTIMTPVEPAPKTGPVIEIGR